MSWLVAILLAIAAFAGMVIAFRLPKGGWTAILAALAMGLAGYALQASPGLPGAPKPPRADARGDAGWTVVEMRQQLVGEDNRSTSGHMVTADAFMRQGQYANAARLLRGVVQDNPGDGEAWLAMGNALTFHAEGALTPAALLAYRKAAEVEPDSAGPAFFVGLGLIQQRKLIEAHQLWSQRLEAMPEDAPGRQFLAESLSRFEQSILEQVESARESGL